MPRVKLIRHGLDDKGNDHWGFPIYPWGECPHPPWALRFDPRYPVPFWMYCRACGQAYIHPHHGLTEEQIERGRQRAAELFEDA